MVLNFLHAKCAKIKLALFSKLLYKTVVHKKNLSGIILYLICRSMKRKIMAVIRVWHSRISNLSNSNPLRFESNSQFISNSWNRNDNSN